MHPQEVLQPLCGNGKAFCRIPQFLGMFTGGSTLTQEISCASKGELDPRRKRSNEQL